MDKSWRQLYSLPVPGTEEEGYTAIHRHPNHVDSPASYEDYYDGKIRTGWDIFQRGLSFGADAPCVGTRQSLGGDVLGDYEFNSYASIERQAQEFGSGLLNLGVIKETTDRALGSKNVRMLGVYMANSQEWLVCEQVCNGYDLCIVPIYDTLGEESTIYILENSDINVVVCDLACAEKLVNVLPKANKSTLRAIIITKVEAIPQNITNAVSGLKVYTWDEIVLNGIGKLLAFTPPSPDHWSTLSYTSGTSGVPKGVVITHKQLASTVTCVIQEVCCDDFPAEAVKCYLSYLPLAHVYERLYINCVYFIGGRIGIYSGNIRNILDDLKALKPTVFVSVPRLYARIHDRVLANVKQKSGIIQWLFNTALNAKLHRLNKTGEVKHGLWDRAVFKRFPSLFGGKVMWMMTGSAPLQSLTYNRIRAIFSTPLVSGYGLTEIVAGGFLNKGNETDPTHVGGPIPSLEFRLRSLPDLEYSVKDKNPRGELLLRGNNVTPGYFRNEVANTESFEDGWLLTGDIVELLPNGAIRVIDRRKNLFKLCQGEYLSPEKLESIIQNASLVSQAFVTGDPQESHPVAVVVPDEDELYIWARSNKFGNLTVAELSRLPRLMEDIMKQINQAYDRAEVKGFERCKRIHIEPEPFSIENGLYTSTNKLRRHLAHKKYGQIIQQLYNDASGL